MNKKLLQILSASLFLFAVSPLEANGPRTVTTTGEAVRWIDVPAQPVSVDLETTLTVRSYDVAPLIDAALGMWENPGGLNESDVVWNQRSLGADVTSTNMCDYLYGGSCSDESILDNGKNPLIIDDDGSITAAFFGADNKYTTLGFASIVTYDPDTGGAGKGEAVFNAACLKNAVPEPGCATTDSGNLSFTDDDFTSFIVHETGHFLGLDHSQVNLQDVLDCEASPGSTPCQYINTMFPIFIIGNGASFKVPHRDDQVGLARLYPTDNFTLSTWTITGTVFKSDGSTQLQCGNLVARNQASDTAMQEDAISAISGDFDTANTNAGTYTMLGLTPGETYTMEVEEIPDTYLGSSGYTPCLGNGSEDAPPQFTAQAPTTTYSKSGGETQTGVNFTTDAVAPPPTPASGGCSLLP
jgi:hypothetical protein